MTIDTLAEYIKKNRIDQHSISLYKLDISHVEYLLREGYIYEAKKLDGIITAHYYLLSSCIETILWSRIELLRHKKLEILRGVHYVGANKPDQYLIRWQEQTETTPDATPKDQSVCVDTPYHAAHFILTKIKP